MNSQPTAESHYHSHSRGGQWTYGRQNLVLWRRQNHCHRYCLRSSDRRTTMAVSFSYRPIIHLPLVNSARYQLTRRLRSVACRGQPPWGKARTSFKGIKTQNNRKSTLQRLRNCRLVMLVTPAVLRNSDMCLSFDVPSLSRLHEDTILLLTHYVFR